MSVINTNITSMIGQSNLNKSQNALQTSMERLSSGLRINSAKDDAAGQAIANRMTSQITGLAQAQRNANDGISVAQTAEGALNQVNDNLQRIRELSVQAQNGTNSANDLQSIQDEITQRLNEIDRISEETNFNGVAVLNTNDGLQIQVGANDGETISVNLQTINAETLGLADFDVRSAAEVELSDEVDAITTGDDISGFASTTTFADDVVIQAGNVQLASVAGDFGGIDNGAAVTSISFQVSDNDTLYARVTITGSDGSGGTETETRFVAISASNVSAGGTVDLASVDLTTAPTTADSPVAASTSDLTFTFEYDTAGIQNAPASGAVDLVEREGELFIRHVDGDETNIFQIPSSQISAGGTTITFDFDGASAAFTATEVAVIAGSNPVQGTLHQVEGLDGDPVYVDDRGDDGLFLVDISAGGTANVQQATATSAGGTEIDVEVRFGGIDGETLYAQVDVERDGETVTANFAVTGDAQNGFVVDLDNEISINDTQDPMAALDAALNQVDNLRSSLGAVQNRFEDAITNLSTNETNLAAARSRIEDADYAVEVANMTRAQILQQAGTSVLAQANQIPQNVLSLLG
jgi:flagellin